MQRAVSKTLMKAALVALATLSMSSAFAHEGVHGNDLVTGFGAGFTHPMMGLDHLLAMVAVGIWAAQARRAAMWVLPLVFPAMMVAGAGLAFAGVQLPAVEGSIAASVVVLGLLIAFAIRMPVGGAAAMVSLFALAHGYAHGAELPQNASAWMYGAGFVLATGLLHIAGLSFSRFADHALAQKAMRVAGVGMAAVGMFLFAGLA